ncbi:MAG: hypothetical protein NT018_10390 [Armatimonadetes bacterium]|nr:hypothetical protein [Armatimonadota bacterium]
MLRNMLIALLALAAYGMVGCGSSSSSNGGTNSFVIRIESTRVTPKFTTVKVNDTVQFVNSDTLTHQIVSGALDAQGNPLILHLITIGNTGFNPIAMTANLGDKVRFSNASMSLTPFVLDIVDDNGQLISSLTLPVGDSQVFDFPTAGVFTFRSHADPLFKGTITLFGQPSPSGFFQSPILRNGDVFTKQFTTPGTFSFYALDQKNPNKSFIIGTVTVQ